MFNVYPWGLSLNVVEPLGPAETRIRFLAYAFGGQAGGPDSHALHATELENKVVVEQVRTGTSALGYHPGRLLPECKHGLALVEVMAAYWVEEFDLYAMTYAPR